MREVRRRVVHHHRGRAARAWRAELEAAMPLRGRWLRYLGRGIVALCILALPIPVAVVLAGMGTLAAVMVLITAAVTRIEGCVLPEMRDFSRRMFRLALLLFFGGIALVVVAAMTEPVRIMLAPTLYHRSL